MFAIITQQYAAVDVYTCVLHWPIMIKLPKRRLEISCKQGRHEAKTEATLRDFGLEEKKLGKAAPSVRGKANAGLRRHSVTDGSTHLKVGVNAVVVKYAERSELCLGLWYQPVRVSGGGAVEHKPYASILQERDGREEIKSCSATNHLAWKTEAMHRRNAKTKSRTLRLLSWRHY